METALLGEGRIVCAVSGRQGGYLVLPTAARAQYVVSINGQLQCFVVKWPLIWDGRGLTASKYISAFYKNKKSLCAHRTCMYIHPRA